jgi:UDPglucose 6-dehydrogenase
LVRIAQDYGAPSRLVESVVAVNDSRKANMAMRVIAACGGSVRQKTIAVLGLTFKPETDDMREAPSVPLVTRLVHDGATLRVFDPKSLQDRGRRRNRRTKAFRMRGPGRLRGDFHVHAVGDGAP